MIPSHPTPLDGLCAKASLLEAALAEAINERIAHHVDQGTEDLARRFFGDEAVDDWFRSQGWDPDAARSEVAA